MVIRVDGAAAVPTDIKGPDTLTEPIAVRPEDTGQAITIEFPPVSQFYGLREQVKTAERIALIAIRNCLAPHQLRSHWLEFSDGTLVSRDGRVSSQVNGCPATNS